MCSVCGCGDAHAHSEETPPHNHVHTHGQSRLIRLEQDVLAQNNQHAAANRKRFSQSGTLTLNLVSSPGSGKTSLLVNTLRALKKEFSLAVIEGDQQTDHDARRIRETGINAVQINTGKGCHLDAHMIGHALDELASPLPLMLFIENVGNLVCPASFDLGEARRVVILSVTEGEDKPLKYPDIFASADLMVLNKIDLLPHLDFNTQQCIDYARRVNPRIQMLTLSATTGEGCEGWHQWLRSSAQMQRLGE